MLNMISISDMYHDVTAVQLCVMKIYLVKLLQIYSDISLADNCNINVSSYEVYSYYQTSTTSPTFGAFASKPYLSVISCANFVHEGPSP
jgi:hypothetical protein